jgi:hypothetical protein
MAVGAQRVAVDERVRHRIEQLVAREPEQAADHGGRRDLDQQHVVEPDGVEGILECEAALDLVGLNHRDEHVAHRERLPAGRDGRAGQPVGRREDPAEVVGRMTPFGGEPGVVEVQPADHRADVERGLYGIELEGRAGHLRAVRHDRARHDGAEQLGAGRVGERLESASERVDQAMTRRLQRERAVDAGVEHVVDDVDEYRIRRRADVGDRGGHRGPGRA